MIYKQGNLLDAFASGQVNAIAHQVNCFGTGSGFAAFVNQEYPIVKRKEEDLKNILLNPIDRYGFVLPVPVYFGIIFNMYSQYEPGHTVPESKYDCFDTRLDMLSNCLDHINFIYPNLKIGFPLVASGLAASKVLKQNKTELEYFKEYIAPTFESFNNPNWIIYYL